MVVFTVSRTSLLAERDRKLRKIQIKVASERPTATVDDIKASVMSLKLGRTSPSIRKATSSQSLHSELGGRGWEGVGGGGRGWEGRGEVPAQ